MTLFGFQGFSRRTYIFLVLGRCSSQRCNEGTQMYGTFSVVLILCRGTCFRMFSSELCYLVHSYLPCRDSHDTDSVGCPASTRSNSVRCKRVQQSWIDRIHCIGVRVCGGKGWFPIVTARTMDYGAWLQISFSFRVGKSYFEVL